MKEILKQRFLELDQVLKQTLEQSACSVAQAADLIVQAYHDGRGLFLFGNGGSAADAQHMAAELNGRYLKERHPFKAQALVGDMATITSIANDYGYDQIFSKQLLANAQSGDIAFGFSTSGNSSNVIEAFKTAKSIGLKTVAMTGQDGGSLAEFADVLIEIPSAFTPHVQEVCVVLYHCLCEHIELALS
ncbi:MAG: SIS domain-containing protein [Kiritimatiellaceae bacterium]|nr:SIS domain-containing protein [Kiritimatiellaceae bacterium]